MTRKRKKPKIPLSPNQAVQWTSPKSTFASIRCNYTKCNLVNALKKIDNSIYLVGGANIDNIEERLNEYKNYNSSIETILVPQTKELAHFEHPEKIAELVKTYFC